MAPALQIEHGFKSCRQPQFVISPSVAGRARRAGTATLAGAITIPRLIPMVLTDPPDVIAADAFHCASTIVRKGVALMRPLFDS
jgi:hypothetical protein